MLGKPHSRLVTVIVASCKDNMNLLIYIMTGPFCRITQSNTRTRTRYHQSRQKEVLVYTNFFQFDCETSNVLLM